LFFGIFLVCVVKIEPRNHWILLCIFDWNQFCPTFRDIFPGIPPY
jgi:hypothetical protein